MATYLGMLKSTGTVSKPPYLEYIVVSVISSKGVRSPTVTSHSRGTTMSGEVIRDEVKSAAMRSVDLSRLD